LYYIESFTLFLSAHYLHIRYDSLAIRKLRVYIQV